MAMHVEKDPKWDAMVEGFAWWIWAESWAGAMEHAKEDGVISRLPWGPGGQIDPHVPPVPQKVTAAAKKILKGTLEEVGIMPGALLEIEQHVYNQIEDAEDLGKNLGAAWIGSGAADYSRLLTELLDETLGHGELVVDIVGAHARVGYLGGKWVK